MSKQIRPIPFYLLQRLLARWVHYVGSHLHFLAHRQTLIILLRAGRCPGGGEMRILVLLRLNITI